MVIFLLIAAGITVGHAIVAWERPRVAVIVSGLIWLLYTVYEYYVATGVLCDTNCNIRVDLVFFIPVLAIATFWAYQSYMGKPGPKRGTGIAFGIIGLFAFGLIAEGYGYKGVSYLAIAGIIAIIVYAVVSRSKAKRSASPPP